MRTFCGVFLQSLSCINLTFGQALVNHRVLSGNGSDQSTVIATDSSGFAYVARNTTLGSFPVINALHALPPQGALEVERQWVRMTRTRLVAERLPLSLRGGDRLNGVEEERTARGFHLLLTGILFWILVLLAVALPFFTVRKTAATLFDAMLGAIYSEYVQHLVRPAGSAWPISSF